MMNNKKRNYHIFLQSKKNKDFVSDKNIKQCFVEVDFKNKPRKLNIMYDEELETEMGNSFEEYVKQQAKQYLKENYIQYTKSNLQYEREKILTKNGQYLIEEVYNENKGKSVIIINDKNMKIGRKNILENELNKYNIYIKGIDITDGENKAIHSIQTLMTTKSYYDDYINNNEIGVFYFTPSEYLECYGVKKYISSRGKSEFSRAERDEAIKSLLSLTEKRFFIYYRKRYKKEIDGKIKWKNDLAEEITPLLTLINIYGDITDEEAEDFIKTQDDKKLKKINKIGIKPHNIFIEGIENNFVMKNSNYLIELKENYRKVSKFTGRFIDLLISYVSQNIKTKSKREKFDWMFQRDYKTLAINLRMNSYIEKRRWKRIRNVINKSYEIAKELGYLINYEIDVKGKTKTLDRLTLNPDKFYNPE